jgi:predicted PurR-regulated permease PerM
MRLPELSAFMSESLDSLSPEVSPAPAAVAPVEPEKKGFDFWGLFSSDEPAPAPLPAAPAEKTGGEVVSDKIMESGLEVALSMLVATPVIIAQMMTCLILFLFLLIFGPKLFEVAIEQSAQAGDRRRTIVLVATLRRHLSRYIVTVSIINTCLGAATALALWWLGVEDALLWGVVVAVLNFAPYIGPLLAIGILCLAGLTQYGLGAAALMPALVYLGLDLLEAQVITPMVLGRKMRLNPLIVMLWLVVWGWLWGASGVLLAVPLLVCSKLVAESLHIAPGWIRILESEM